MAEIHFTYDKSEPGSDLQQGDILFVTDQLRSLIEKYHPYYLDSKFTAYLVTTQSCDLVRRSDGVGAAYINLCAIKPFAKVIEREIRKYQTDLLVAAEAVSSRNKDRIVMFIERLLNNNHPEYFYLHEDVANGLSERSCAYLRVAISLKTEHYNACLAARKLTLRNDFQAKLGWLVGNLYSRVGTEDWAPKTKSEAQWKELLQTILVESVVVIDEKKAQAAKSSLTLKDVEGLPSEEIRKRINQLPTKKKKDKVIEAIITQIKDDNLISEADLVKLRGRLVNNATLSSLLKS